VHTDIKPENLVLAVGEEIGTNTGPNTDTHTGREGKDRYPYRPVGEEPHASALDTPEEDGKGGGGGSEEVLLADGGDGTVGGAGGVRGSIEGERGAGVEKLQGLQELQELREFVYRKKGGWLERLCAFVEASGVRGGGGSEHVVGWRGGGRVVRTEIVDLGNSCLESKPFTEEIQTIEYRSPEVILRAGNAILKSVYIDIAYYLPTPTTCR
jgi:serine/threonine protein kinase